MHKCNIIFNALQHGRQFVNERLLLRQRLRAWPVQQDDHRSETRAQTISNVVLWSAMSIGDNAISALATMATTPWLTDRSSDVRRHA